MSRSTLFLSVLTLAVMVPSLAAADVPGAFRGDVSALGMGNTGVAVSGRGCLWHYNPALLNTVQADLSIPNVDFGANGKTFEFFDFLEERQDDFGDWDDLSGADRVDFYEDADEFFNRPFGFRTAPLVGFAMQNFGIAAYADTRADVAMVPPGLPHVPRVFGLFRTDAVIQIGTAGAADVGVGRLAMGVNLRYVNRRAQFIEIHPDDLDEVISTLTDDADSFHGWGVDLGAYYPTGFWNLDVGATWHNILGGIQVPAPTEEDPDNKDTEDFHSNLAVGASWVPFPRLLLTADVEDIFNDVQNLEFGDQIHVGAELDMILLKFRTGLFRGSLTAGAGIQLLFFHIDFATFLPGSDAFELTDDDERMYVGQVKFGWQ
jgi:hypothetical protein